MLLDAVADVRSWIVREFARTTAENKIKFGEAENQQQVKWTTLSAQIARLNIKHFHGQRSSFLDIGNRITFLNTKS